MRDLFESRTTVDLEVLAIVGVGPVDDVGIVVIAKARLKVVRDEESGVHGPSTKALEATGCLSERLSCPFRQADKGHYQPVPHRGCW